MKRKLGLILCVIAFLAGFGALLHSPPSVTDVLTGATAQKTANTSSKLSGDYVLCMNPSTDPQLREQIKRFIMGTSETITASSNDAVALYADESDRAVVRYAENLCARLQTAGVHITLKQYSNTMLRSRAVCGRYQFIIVADGIIDEDARRQADCITLHSTEMAVNAA